MYNNPQKRVSGFNFYGNPVLADIETEVVETAGDLLRKAAGIKKEKSNLNLIIGAGVTITAIIAAVIVVPKILSKKKK